MSITVRKEPDNGGWPLENCCMCRKPTAYWFGTGDKNVALCQLCAAEHQESDLPTKAEWIAAELARNPRPFWVTR